MKKEIKKFLLEGKTFKEIADILEIDCQELRSSYSAPTFTLKAGVEIEGYSLKSRSTLCRVVEENTDININTQGWSSGSTKNASWVITTDGSIKDVPKEALEKHSSGRSIGFEIVSPPLVGSAFMGQTREVLRVLRSKDLVGEEGLFKTNKYCGIHIHISHEGLSANQKENVYDAYRFLETEINGMMSHSRVYNKLNGGRSFCKNVGKLDYTQACEGMDGKYWSVRVTRETFEFRRHSSSTSLRKIKMWVLILQQLYNWAIEHSNVFTLGKSKEAPYLREVIDNEVLLDYYNQRKNKFDIQKEEKRKPKTLA